MIFIQSDYLCLLIGAILCNCWYVYIQGNYFSISLFSFLSPFYEPLLPFPWILYQQSAAKSFQSCPTLCDPIDSSPPGFTVPGILQVRTLEWVAISFSSAWKWSESEVSQSCPTLRPHGLQPTRLLHQWDFPGKSTGVGCHCLLRIAQLLAGKPASSFPRGKSVLSS